MADCHKHSFGKLNSNRAAAARSRLTEHMVAVNEMDNGCNDKMLPLAAAVAPLPSAFASFAATQQLRSPLTPQNSLANLLQSPHFQNLIQSQVAALQSQHLAAAAAAAQMECKSPRTPTTGIMPPRKRVGGSTMKTAKVWRFFDELPTPEQAAECRLCRKKIKATNSSTTGMIRHLRSCHVVEYQQVQEARQSSLLLKMEEKAKVQLTREEKPKKAEEAQKSPSASSSASDTASSTASSSFVPLPPLPPLIVPQGLPAPKPLKFPIKTEMTEVEETEEKMADLSCRNSAFCKPEERSQEDDDSKKLNAQIALMIIIDQMSPRVVDGSGFRQLIRFLRPSHQLPYSDKFQSQIIPEIMAQLRHFGTLFMLNNPVNPFETLQAAIPQQVAQVRSSSAESDSDKVSLDVKVEDDSDSASSADSETSLPHEVSRLVDYFGSIVKQEDLQSLATVCHSVFSYFEQRPQLIAQLAFSVSESSDPLLLRDLRFVAVNAEAINAYIRATPDMELLPISDSQARLLADLLGSHSA